MRRKDAGGFSLNEKGQPRPRAQLVIIVGLLAMAWGSTVQAGSRIEEIRTRGHLTCGVLPGVAGFATRDDDGNYFGFEIDLCRALAAAVLGESDKVRFVVVRTVDRFRDQRQIDVVSRRLTWTLRREAENDLLFGPVVFYDGAGFLVRRSAGLRAVEELDNRPLCVRTGSEANRALIDWFDARDLRLVEVPEAQLNEAAEGFFAGSCDALVADVSELAAERAARGEERDEYVILPERISKEPLSMLVRQGDDDFFLVVRWTVFGLVAAEEAGVTSDGLHSASDSGAAVLPGGDVDIGSGLGLDPGWLRSVIRQVGNYGEIYERHLGSGSGIGLERGLNRLWTHGGLMYAPPLH